MAISPWLYTLLKHGGDSIVLPLVTGVMHGALPEYIVDHDFTVGTISHRVESAYLEVFEELETKLILHEDIRADVDDRYHAQYSLFEVTYVLEGGRWLLKSPSPGCLKCQGNGCVKYTEHGMRKIACPGCGGTRIA